MKGFKSRVAVRLAAMLHLSHPPLHAAIPITQGADKDTQNRGAVRLAERKESKPGRHLMRSCESHSIYSLNSHSHKGPDLFLGLLHCTEHPLGNTVPPTPDTVTHPHRLAFSGRAWDSTFFYLHLGHCSH